MKTILDEYAKRCAQGNGVCPAWRDGKYPKMCACLQKNESEYRWFVNTLIITIGCFVVVGELSLLLAL